MCDCYFATHHHVGRENRTAKAIWVLRCSCRACPIRGTILCSPNHFFFLQEQIESSWPLILSTEWQLNHFDGSVLQACVNRTMYCIRKACCLLDYDDGHPAGRPKIGKCRGSFHSRISWERAIQTHFRCHVSHRTDRPFRSYRITKLMLVLELLEGEEYGEKKKKKLAAR